MANSYESFYSGGYSSLSPSYGNFIGYRLNAATLGAPMNPQSANQISEVMARIREGMKNVEIGAISPDVFDQIPKEQFKEIAALTKLTGVKASMHAPIIDPAGFGERGYEGDYAREDAERRLFDAIKRSHDLDPEGNVPVAVHSTAGIPGNEYRPDKDIEPGEEGRFREQKLIAIDQESHEMTGLKEERKYYLSTTKEDFEKGGTLRDVRTDLDMINETDWDNKLNNIVFYKKQADEVLTNLQTSGGSDLAKVDFSKFKGKSKKEIGETLGPYKSELNSVSKSEAFLQNIHQNFTGIFHRAFKYGTDEQKEELKKLALEYQKDRAQIYSIPNPVQRQIRDSEMVDEVFNKIKGITASGAPQVFTPVEDFAMDKAAETFGNVAFKAYEKFGETAPVLAIENMFQGMAFSRAEDLKKLVEMAQKKFVEKAKEEGVGGAEDMAKKLIGVTWDVGHLNMMKKHGFKDEDVVAETKKIAENVKHVHLTDNFGYSDSHLPPGMGNVPLKKILEELEKTGRLGDMRKIVEAGGFVQHFKKSPHSLVLQAFGSPLYSAKMAPYWNQTAEVQGGYFGFPLAYMPEKHFSMYGSGFSLLPEELGGQIPGTQSRFSGAANA